MNFKLLVQSKEWSELKDFLRAEIKDKPLDIKTEGLSADRIALEVLASQLADKKIEKLIRTIERKGKKEELKKELGWK